MNEVWMIIMFSVIFRTFLKGSNGAFLVGMKIWCVTFLFIYENSTILGGNKVDNFIPFILN